MVTKKTTEKVVKEPVKAERYFSAKGGRKTANASARVFNGKGIVVNNKDYKQYFTSPKNQMVAFQPFDALKIAEKMGASVMVSGGGINAQAEAVRNAISRALAKADETMKPTLRRAGYMTRDSRTVERKKYGLLKARRAPQWAKR
jgi:small subunit ribosomal protein S9